MRYETAEEFLKKVRARTAGGRKYYTITQVANGLGVDWNIIFDAIKTHDLEKRLGFTFVENSFNKGRYFPVEAIPKLYKFKDELFKNDEDN